MDSVISGSSALISDIDRRKSLPMIQAWARAGVRVIGISRDGLPLGWYSRYCHHVHRVPDYRSEPHRYLEALERICSSEKPDVFYPIEDEVIVLCSRNRSAWEPYSRALISATSALEQAYDKWETIIIAKRMGIPVPETFCPEGAGEAASIAATWHGEAVIKPRRSSGSRGLIYGG